ncbi:MAG TPA: sucrase ferredoxin [Acidimicrobiales bacterium]|nr:sucrase ferredoxin [Acidimicrobiales bacterium]
MQATREKVGPISSQLDTPTTLRCSEWTHQHEVDPIGTAGTYAGYLLLEWPLPWPHDLSEVPDLAPVVEALAGTGIRLQGLVATWDHGPQRHAILYHRRHDELPGFASFARREVIAPLDGLVASALELLDDRETAPDGSPPALTDVLICGHGRRDRCCGALGTSLALELAAGGGARDEIRLWRTSHTGGHRFAPTMIVLPEATVWAFADADMVERITRRDGSLDDLVPRYRGCSGLGSPRVQALERAVLAEMGWPVLSSVRWGEELPDGSVSLRVQGPDPSAWEGTVTTGRQLPVPVCGSPIDAATKSETELVVNQVRRSDSA